LQSQKEVVLKHIRESSPSDLVFGKSTKEEMQ